MLKHCPRVCLGLFVVFGGLSATKADLATTIVNGDFESATFAGVANVSDAQSPGWVGHGDFDFSALVWGNTGGFGAIPGVPVLSGNYSGGLITAPNIPNQPVGTGWYAALSQSLGTVGAGDVGKVFELSADLGARGFSTHQWNSTMKVAFTADLGSFSNLGTAGVLNVMTPLSQTPVGMETRTAMFAPEAGHVGMEVFAVLHVESLTPFTVDQQQHIVDNVGINVVPEPSSCILLVMAASALASVVARRRKK